MEDRIFKVIVFIIILFISLPFFKILLFNLDLGVVIVVVIGFFKGIFL